MKKIVLLSDGTGNSAAKRHKTNVWRLYQALDVHRDDQIAFYSDGVGSRGFLPFKLLGGAFGWGLKRNVIELYKILCRTYQKKDEIYLFGFSRGAFTVRMLAGMIACRGLYTNYEDEEDLRRTALGNFAAYRSRYKRGWLTRPLRSLIRRHYAPRLQEKHNESAEIEFIGVWDTVDAYGFPVDELAILWDVFIFPLRFVDQNLPDKVRRACHALSVDDERKTFHPVLWSQSNGACIEQVWFAGVHSDVGGGYPMHDLALVTLDWMISKVEAGSCPGGLHFIPEIREEYTRRSDWHGMQHDSRSGVRAYYRYQPREIKRLYEEVNIVASPLVHRGVLERIRHDIVPYAPTALPAEYVVVSTRGEAAEYESVAQAKERAQAMRSAHDVVFWRRWLYAAYVVATAAVVALLWLRVLPQNRWWLASVVVVSVVLVRLRVVASRVTHTRASTAWGRLKGACSVPRVNLSRTTRLRRFLRRSPRILGRVLPTMLFVVLLFVLLSSINHAVFYVRDALGVLCRQSHVAVQDHEPISFEIDDPCFATGVKLKKGVVYRFHVAPADWKDGVVEADPDGFRLLRLLPLTLNRRHIYQPWLKLMGRVGQSREETFVIGSGPTTYQPKSDGELFLYVNDAVLGLPPWDRWAMFYSWPHGENSGMATVEVTAMTVGTLRE